MSLLTSLFSSATKTVASGGIWLYVKLGLAVAVLTFIATAYFSYEHMASEVKSQQTQIGQLQYANSQAQGEITGLQTDLSDVLNRMKAAEDSRAALSDQITTLNSRVSKINSSFAAQLNALKTPAEKQAFINTQLKQQLWCIEQLTAPPSQRDPTYDQQCLTNK